MKKIAVIAIALTVIFSACQTSKTSNNTDTNEAVTNAPANNTTPAAPQAPKEPEYQAKAKAMARTTVEFQNETYNYGKVTQGEKVSHQFKFKNTGTEPLVLTRVKASCGCTTPNYSQEPVAPGEEGYIDVLFNTAGKKGIQNKTVTVTGNFEGRINRTLRISGEVSEGPAQ